MSYLWEPSSCVIQAPRALSSQTRDLLEELKDSHPGVVYECQRHRRQYGEVEQLLELVTNLGPGATTTHDRHQRSVHGGGGAD